MAADIAKTGRAENRIGNRVADNVGVGVAEAAAIRGNRDAADYERTAFDEAVKIVARARTSRPRRRRSGTRARANGLEIVRGGDIYGPASPSTTWTV